MANLNQNFTNLFGVPVTTNAFGRSRTGTIDTVTAMNALAVTQQVTNLGYTVERVTLDLTNSPGCYTDAWIHLNNGLELVVRQAAEGRHADYSSLLGFGSQHGKNQTASETAFELLEGTYEVLRPGTGTKEFKYHVPFDCSNVRTPQNSKVLNDVLIALELAATETLEAAL